MLVLGMVWVGNMYAPLGSCRFLTKTRRMTSTPSFLFRARNSTRCEWSRCQCWLRCWNQRVLLNLLAWTARVTKLHVKRWWTVPTDQPSKKCKDFGKECQTSFSFPSNHRTTWPLGWSQMQHKPQLPHFSVVLGFYFDYFWLVSTDDAQGMARYSGGNAWKLLGWQLWCGDSIKVWMS